ncbi:MAG: hypothetical protein N5P05_001415 [Chroococcopsis gigantea SAG 12.99]|jgi:tetratricopeptide (TPR) repeat protein|nr:hypothetical protein [Chlorogloea purpurea SAG 13.99]MDV2999809.1 hypothetical protein [Chroococcopsis gigantea SAG 12.99]
MWKKGFIFSILLLFTGVAPALGQTEPVPVNPLEVPVEDNTYIPKIDRPLTPIERRRLREYLEKQDKQAQELYNTGKEAEAFGIWYEEIKLSRYLGAVAEVQTLGKVGEKAWNKDKTSQVKTIIERMENIQKKAEVNQETNAELLSTLGIAYEQVRSIDNALVIYDKLLANAKIDGNQASQETYLSKIGELHLMRFDYAKAGPIYEDLLGRAKTRSDSLKSGIYLQRLAEIYRESSQPANAVRIKEELVENYLKNQQIQSIPELKIAIGSDYQALKDPNKAGQSFQEAYALAWSIQQLGTAAEALDKLAELYKSYQQIDYALQIYQELLKVQQLGYNYYGLMNTYDKIGQIYLEKNNLPLAMDSFQKGWELSKAIRYNEEYFQTRMAQVNQAMNPPEPEPQPTP